MAQLEMSVDQNFCNRVYKCERVEQLFPTKRSFQSALNPSLPPFMEIFVGEEEFCHLVGEDNFLICLNFALSLLLSGAMVVAEKVRKHSEPPSNL
jgi:hypothetical protein